jgi:hypothetical protein
VRKLFKWNGTKALTVYIAYLHVIISPEPSSGVVLLYRVGVGSGIMLRTTSVRHRIFNGPPLIHHVIGYIRLHPLHNINMSKRKQDNGEEGEEERETETVTDFLFLIAIYPLKFIQ